MLAVPLSQLAPRTLHLGVFRHPSAKLGRVPETRGVERIVLQRLMVRNRQATWVREHLLQSSEPRVLRALLEEQRWVVVPRVDVMIRRRDPAALRIHLTREIAAQPVP